MYALLYDKNSDRLMVGNGAGDIEVLNADFELVEKYRLHQDLITVIKWVGGESKLIATGSIDTTLKVSKAYSTEVIARLEFNEPVWSFAEYASKLWVPLLSQSKIVREYWRENPIVEDSDGCHRQIVQVGPDLLAVGLDLNWVINLTTGAKEQLEAHAIGSFQDQLVVVNENEMLLQSK